MTRRRRSRDREQRGLTEFDDEDEFVSDPRDEEDVDENEEVDRE